LSVGCGIIGGWATLLTTNSKGLQMSKFFNSTTTLTTLIQSVDADGVGSTYRGYDRFPVGHDYYLESECDVCNGEEAVARLVDTGEAVCGECRQEAVAGGEKVVRL